MRSNSQSSSTASLAALVSAGSLAALLTPSNSSNIKGLSLNLAPAALSATPTSATTAASASTASSASARSLAPTPPASVSPNGYHPYQMPGSGAGNTRHAPNCASTLDDRPTKRRRPAGSSSSSASAMTAPAMPVPVHPVAPFTMMSAANMPLTPNTPTSQFHFGSCAMGSSSSASFATLPTTPLTPVSPVDMVQHQLFHQQQGQQHRGTPTATTAPIAVAAYAFDPRPPSAAPSSSASPSIMNASCRGASFPLFQHQQHLSHAAELARRQVSPVMPSSGIFLVAEHRGLVKESSSQLLQQQSVAGASQVGPRGDGILAVVPNDGLELMFRTEARLPICDHFLYHHTNMSGGCQVAFARKHTIGWLIEVRFTQAHVFLPRSCLFAPFHWRHFRHLAVLFLNLPPSDLGFSWAV
ncbi:hypothetical protein BCR44DRAFT_30974 [Catenaria anguillulae PL171]|uniref:Uncharacterized protein n=1 Tax=Catenaria anguillulae PL171 TaxID=765915 RepID=A0A1Y2HK62_9FUNG|nr:hypothetical protein BCR44DRAFT_30974 [Catenaria anguillulae PL171]